MHEPFVLFVAASMSVFALVLALVTWITHKR